MSIDDRLLLANTKEEKEADQEEPEESTDRAGELRRRVRGLDSGQEQDWQSHSGKRRRAGRKGGAQEAIKDAIPQPSLSTASSSWLRGAWLNSVTTFGFSLFYLYAHLALKSIFGERLFAPFGSEWGDRPGITVQQRDAKGKIFKTAENFGVGAISLLLLVLIIGGLSVVALIVDAVSNPLRLALEVLKDFFKLE